MRVKRFKGAKKTLAYYQINFGLREPYRVIVDGTVCQVALESKIHIQTQLAKYLGGTVKLFTTAQCVDELKKMGPEMSGAVFVAKRMEIYRKNTDKNLKGSAIRDSVSSILAAVGKKNMDHLIIATQDKQLRNRLREVGGVPILYINYNCFVLEAPSKETIAVVAAKNDDASGITAEERALVKKLEPKKEKPVQRKRHKAKGPNPLSMKKKKKVPSGAGGAGVSSVKTKEAKASTAKRKPSKAAEKAAEAVVKS